jgi:hypothetical protein
VAWVDLPLADLERRLLPSSREQLQLLTQAVLVFADRSQQRR